MERPLLPKVEALEGKALLSQLAVSLTTNRHIYRAGEVVRMTLTEENLSGRDVTVGIGPGLDVFSLAHKGATLWRSTAGAVPEFIAERALAPGESLTLQAQWKAGRDTGMYVVHNQAAPNGPVAKFCIVKR
jgi:hypothetical protein